MPIDAQCESSNPGCAHNGAPFTHGESPGWNFQGPFSATAEFPSVINSGEEVDEVAGVLAAFAVCEKARGEMGSTNRRNNPALFMPARVPFCGTEEIEQFRIGNG